MQTTGSTSFSQNSSQPQQARVVSVIKGASLQRQARQTKPVQAIAPPINPSQEQAILDLLTEGILVIRGETAVNDHDTLEIAYANRAFQALFDGPIKTVTNMPLTTIFPHQTYPKLFETLHRIQQTNEQQDLELVLKAEDSTKNLFVTLMPYDGHSFAQSFKAGKPEPQIVCCVHDTTALTVRANYLEDRAIKLIDHANVLEGSRRDLEKQLLALRKEVSSMERAARIDPISGLPNRPYFLERGSAEFQRSLRYGHKLSVVVCAVQGYDHIKTEHGQEAADAAITGLSQMCETAYRAGTDIGGRTGDAEIAILLPETDLTGALLFVDRLRQVISKTPIHAGNGLVRLGMVTGVDEVQSDDYAFLQCLSRAHEACPSTGG